MADRIGRPRGVKAADWNALLMDVEDYRELAENDPMGEVNEAAQRVAEKCVQLLLTADGSNPSGVDRD